MDLGVELVLPLEEAGGRSLPPRTRASGRERVRDGRRSRGPASPPPPAGPRRARHERAGQSAGTAELRFPFAWEKGQSGSPLPGRRPCPRAAGGDGGGQCRRGCWHQRRGRRIDRRRCCFTGRSRSPRWSRARSPARPQQQPTPECCACSCAMPAREARGAGSGPRPGQTASHAALVPVARPLGGLSSRSWGQGSLRKDIAHLNRTAPARLAVPSRHVHRWIVHGRA